MLKQNGSVSSFPVVHPCKPDKAEPIKSTSFNLMPYTDGKPSIIAIPSTGLSGNQQEIFKEVIPYPRSIIQTVVEKSSPSKILKHSNIKSINTKRRKHSNKRQLDGSCTTSELNGNAENVLHHEDSLSHIESRQLSNTSSSIEEDSKFQLDSLLEELDFKCFLVSQYEHLVSKFLTELSTVRYSQEANATSLDSNNIISPDLTEIENLNNVKLFLSTAINDLKSSMTSLLSENCALKSNLKKLLKDHKSYEQQTDILKKSLTSLLIKVKKGKEERKCYQFDFPDVNDLDPCTTA